MTVSFSFWEMAAWKGSGGFLRRGLELLGWDRFFLVADCFIQQGSAGGSPGV
jgi:hypothetical protein